MRVQIPIVLVGVLICGCSGSTPTPAPTSSPVSTSPPTDTPPAPTEAFVTDTPGPIEPTFRSAIAYDLTGMGDVSVQSERYESAEGQLGMDLYYPPDRSDAPQFPVVVFVSAFKAPAADHRSLPAYQSWGRLVAASGMVGVVYETDNSEDLRALINYLIAHADDLSIDPSKIGLWASSSNAPTALSHAMRSEENPTRFLVTYYGFMLTPDNFQRSDHDNLCASIGCYGEELLDIEQIRTDLPVFIAKAGRDNFRLNNTIDHFVELASTIEAPVVLVEHEDGVHAFDSEQKDARSAEIIELTLQFIKSHFGME